MEFEEKERIYILQIRAGRNLELSCINSEKERKLKIIIKNRSKLSRSSYFSLLDNLIDLKIE